MEKRAYKLQEFVAHASSVNCLSIGKKSSRLFITGGEDHKVNLWAIGKSSSLLSLSGHTSSVESVIFDSAEVLVLSGASTGAIKLWDLEEGKILRTLTGHRLNCTAVEFHPFGEFFASGSSDANLKLWDIRKKGCLHTYKGHTQGVTTIKFTPDGRWVVSGGADNVVKIWDLTAGKLLHEFKFHVGQIQCIDFHPMEFLLATGSADRTVKFWDLETFELIGSAGPEATGIRSMTFHPDGRTLFCGLNDCLKIFSWEPIKCHDAVEMGWSTLGDLSIHDGKLLACSYYRNCVDVWVADISLIEPHRVGASPQINGIMEQKFNVQEIHSPQKLGGNVKSSTELLTSPREYETTEIRNIYVDTLCKTTDSRKAAPRRVGSVNAPKVVRMLDSYETCDPSTPKIIPVSEPRERTSSYVTSRPFTPPVIVPRSNAENTVNSRTRRESISAERTSPGMRREPMHVRRPSNSRSEAKLSMEAESGANSSKTSGSDSSEEPKFYFRFLTINESTTINEENNNIKSVSEKFERTLSPGVPLSSSHENCAEAQNCSGGTSSKSVSEKFERTLSPDVPLSSSHENCAEAQNCSGGTSSTKPVNGVLAVEPGRTRSLVQRWERREKCNNTEAQTTSGLSDVLPETDTLPPKLEQKGQPPISESEASGLIKKEREASGLMKKEREASPLIKKEREALGLIDKEREASPLIKKEREASGLIEKERGASPLIKKEREASGLIEKERGASPLIKKEREASGLIEKERGASPLIKKEREASGLIEKERGASPLIKKEREASGLIEKERGASPLIKKEREAPPLIKKEREASGLIEKERGASVLIEKEREALGLIEKEREASSTSDEDVIEVLMQNHDIFLSDLRSRLTKLQVVRHFWLRNDVKGGIDAVGKLPDHCVQADVASVLVEKMEIVTLDLFTCLLPVFMGLLNSNIDRHTNVSLEMLLKLVAIFGPVILSTISATPSVKVDLQAERRREICNQCFIHLQKIKQLLPSVIRRGGALAKVKLEKSSQVKLESVSASVAVVAVSESNYPVDVSQA
ncbi:WD40 repeat [Macleaya cordata]|uniref:Katanin p80 WD40 repeat-containing subunit B1 homolog n=1 Tax=Macleaya cordata TaxID=56857 RepID=A0A200QRZ3_MACCD|nr:WD40 repeat [Macleaya cordata]